VCGKNGQFSVSQGALFRSYIMPAFGQRKAVRVYAVAKENLTSIQEKLLWFWQTKGALDVTKCLTTFRAREQQNLSSTRKNMSRKT
jgi:hypothetical protein